jgi:protein CpxP
LKLLQRNCTMTERSRNLTHKVTGALTATAAAAAPTARADHQKKRDEHRAQHAKHMQERMDKFKAALQLTPAQQPAWDTFTQAMRPAGGAQPAPRALPGDRAEFAKLTTPQRIEKMRNMRAERNAAAERREQATTTFYAALTPAQQKTFDEQAARQFGPKGPRDGMRKGDRHGHRDMHRGQKPAVQPAPAAK